jgi:hypothetical protein
MDVFVEQHDRGKEEQNAERGTAGSLCVCGSNACRSAPPGIRPSSRERDSSADKRVSE